MSLRLPSQLPCGLTEAGSPTPEEQEPRKSLHLALGLVMGIAFPKEVWLC